jgi:hypothetical protein
VNLSITFPLEDGFMKVFHGNDTQPNLRVTTQTEVLREVHFAGHTGAGFQKVLELSGSTEEEEKRT